MSQQNRIPVLVIGGYLGAGKTTLINRMLTTATQRIAVVVNDFGSVNIDASLIRERHNDTIELTNGCICCAVGESLADVLFTILERAELPEVVVIEASGVANPAAVAYNTGIWAIFFKLSRGEK
jgi:G3E family GTPase